MTKKKKKTKETKDKEIPEQELSPLELIDLELYRLAKIEIHPLIDYHPNIGLVTGCPLDSMTKVGLIIAETVFIADLNTGEVSGDFPQSITLRPLKWIELSRRTNEQLVRVFKEIVNGKWSMIPPTKTVFESVFQGIQWYYYHSNELWYVVLACWIIGTYFHPIFYYYPVLVIQGLRETGKTTLMSLIDMSAWNTTGKEAVLREANLFRTIEGGRVTYIVDITKMNFKEDRDVIDVIETGSEKGGFVRRIDKDTETPIRFATFSPKAIATRYSLPFAAKCITIISEQATNLEYGKRGTHIEFDERFEAITHYCIKAAMMYWNLVVDAYNSIEPTEKLMGRVFNYWTPILTICKVFAPSYYDEVLEFAEEMATKQEKGDNLSDVEDVLLMILGNYAADTEQKSIDLLQTKLRDDVKAILSFVKSYHPVKAALTNLGVIKRQNQTNRGVSYQIDLEKVLKIYEERNLGEIKKINEEETPKEEQSSDEPSKPKKKTLSDYDIPVNSQNELTKAIFDFIGKEGALENSITHNISLQEKYGKFRIEEAIKHLVDYGALYYDPKGLLKVM